MRKLILIIFVIVCSQNFLSAGEKKIISNLTLDKAIEIALKENSQIKIARYDIEKSESKLTESFSSLFPSISAEGTYIRNIKKPVFFLPDFFGGTGQVRPIEIGSKNSYSGQLKLGLPIFVGQAYTGIVMSKLGLELSNLSYEETLAQIRLNTTKAFLDVLLTRETEKFIKQSYENALSNLENAEKLNKQGILSDFEYLSAQVEVEKIKPNVLQAEYTYETALNFLKTLLNLSSEDSIEVVGSIENFFTSKTLPQIDSYVVENTFTLKKLGLQKQIADKNIMLQRWGHFPSLVAFGNYQIQTQAEDYNFNTYRWVKSASVGLTLSVPIFSGFGVKSRVEQAEIQFKQLEETINYTKKQLDIAITNTKNRMATALEKIEAQKLNREKARINYRIAEVRYNEGMSTQIEISNANVNLLSAELGYAQAIYEYLVAQAELEFYLNKSTK
ncbi:MAG: TolC family protein [Ignavibacteria bacterium]|jgi:outer membrane protein TolC|nr:TolC family protein [Ignavibacteria bacterium]MDH7528895.1 TolC family protein [Ignavibacteria bacterium]